MWYAKVLSEPLAPIEQYRILFPSIVTLWLLMTTLWVVTCDDFPRDRGKLSHHIQLHEKWYPNSIEQKYSLL